MLTKYIRRSFSSINFPELSSQFPFNLTKDISIISNLDKRFAVNDLVINDLLTNKENFCQVKNLYLQYVMNLVNNGKMDVLKVKLETRLYQKSLSLLKTFQKNNIKIAFNDDKYNQISSEELLNQLQIRHIGSLKVYGLDIDRMKNKFIHEYIVDRKGTDLFYDEKVDIKQENLGQIETKTQKLQKEMMDTMIQKKEESKLKFYVMETARFLGMTPVKETPVKDPVTMAKDFSKNIFKNVESKTYILVEDYELITPFGLVLYKQDENKAENEKFGEIDPTSTYKHILRVEKFIEAKDAPSIRKQKEFILSDIDYMMKGNPHSLVKTFIKVN